MSSTADKNLTSLELLARRSTRKPRLSPWPRRARRTRAGRGVLAFQNSLQRPLQQNANFPPALPLLRQEAQKQKQERSFLTHARIATGSDAVRVYARVTGGVRGTAAERESAYAYADVGEGCKGAFCQMGGKRAQAQTPKTVGGFGRGDR